MQLSLDIGSFVLGLVTAILVPLVVWWLNRDRRKRDERRQLQVQRYRDRQQAYDELMEAFSIHESLTEPEMIEAIARVHTDEAAKALVVARHFRASYRFDAFSNDFPIPETVADEIKELLGAIHQLVPTETDAAQHTFDEKLILKQNHTKNATVQTRVRDFASHFAGHAMSPGETSDAAAQFHDLVQTVRLTRGSQAVEFVLPDGTHKIWFAGSGKGELPATVAHIDKYGCELKSSKAGSLKTRLAQHNSSGEELAIELVRELRELASVKDLCSCGAPLRFA